MSVEVLPQGDKLSEPRSLDFNLAKGHLRALWAEILGQDGSDFSEEDVFFEVGGNSISALELATAAQSQGVFLTVEQIFEHVTLEEMAREALLSQPPVEELLHHGQLAPFELLARETIHDQKSEISKACCVTTGQVQDAYPCTPMQESLVSLSEGQENLSVRQLVYRLRDDLPLDRFKEAWDLTARANPIMRTRICQLEGQLRFTQAVIDEDIRWTHSEDGLSRFLEHDVNDRIGLGHRFFRFAIIHQGDERFFVWTVHHALCDAASILNLLEDVTAHFEGNSVVQRAPFNKFIQASVGADLDKEREFWKSSVAGVDVTPFPQVSQAAYFHANPSSTTEKSISLPHRAPSGVTMALFLRGAWGVLLSHHTGTENVVFGTINNGRNSTLVPDMSRMTGPTINLLPAVVQVNPKQSAEAFLASIRSQAAQVMPFEHTGISKIRSYLAGSESAATDFQTLFVVHAADFGSAGQSSLQKLGVEYLSHLGKTEQHSYPLIVSITLGNDGNAILKIQHDEHVISSQQATNLAHQYQAVVSRLGNAPGDTPIGSISSLSENDVAQIREWNHNAVCANNTCIHHLFKEQVHRTPDAEAICSLKHSLTYAQVDELSSALALQLNQAGVGPETAVAVCFEKSVWTAIAMLAVFKAGGFYVPIDPAHPQGRITEIVETVKIQFGIASVQSAAALRGLCGFLIELDRPEKPVTKTSLPQHVTDRVKPFNTAYLLFTSGSTGKPKGVVIPHSAMSTSIMNHGPAFGASPGWRTLQFAAHTFDISMTEFCTTLAFGGCVCVPSEDDRMNDLAGAITRLKANVALVVPTVANLLSPSQVPTLKTLVLGGEPVTKETISKWADHVDLTAGYGPSETAVYCSGNIKAPADAHPADIGRSIGGTMWIVNPDDYNKLTAIGCVGEIAISGAIVGNGYFGDAATTEKAFVPAPEWLRKLSPGTQHGKIYRTGDLARYNPDGTFRIVGRSDTQVKLRGFRIELGEIENRIKEHGLVVAALATLPSNGPCSKQIVAVICLNRSDIGHRNIGSDEICLAKKQSSENLDKIKAQISLTLPDYMIPSVWITLEKFPLLLSGKIDRKLIKTWVERIDVETYNKLVGNLDEGGSAPVIPGTTPDTIRYIWAEVLNADPAQIGLKTSFFALGGDSIAAIHVVAKARKMDISVTTTGIMSQKTLGNLSTLIDQNKNQAGAVNEVEEIAGPHGIEGIRAYANVLRSRLEGRPEVQVEDSYPFNPIQREILRQRQINPAIFVLSWKMEFTSKLPSISLERLARAWSLVVQKHHILRSIFLEDPDGKLPSLQVTLKNAEPSIAISSSEPGEHEPTMDELLPALDDCFLPHRAHFSLRGDRYYGHIELDHLVIDGWSFRLIKEDLLAAYDFAGTELSPPEFTFKSVVEAHRPSRIEKDRKYWAEILRDQQASRLSFPVGPGIEKPPSSAKTVIYLPELDIEALSKFSSKYNITPASIFDAAWAQTLSLFSASPDVTYEYVVSNRDLDVNGIFDIVGPVMNLLAFHLRNVSTEHSPHGLANVANRIQDQRLQDGGHTTSNLREVIQEDMKRELPFNTALNFQRRPLGVQIGDLKVYDHLRRSSDPWHFDVLVRILHIMDDNIVRPSIEFDARLFDETKMNEVANAFWGRVQIAID